MASSDFTPLTGHCVCGTITYTLTAPPLVTHCCHCTYCQSETGSAFGLNTLIESYSFSITSPTQPLLANRPSPSAPDGSKHLVAYCPNKNCNTDIYSFYEGNRSMVFVKAGSFDAESRKRVSPDVHIFASSKVPWVNLSGEAERGVKVYEHFYEHEDVWSKESLERRAKLRAWRAQQKVVGEDV